jgi:hypothetical protein
VATFPGLAIFVTVLGFNLFGDGLRDAWDPVLSRGGPRRRSGSSPTLRTTQEEPR